MQTKGYRAGDRIWYRNQYSQSFYATITTVWRDKLIVKRDEWPREELIDLDDYPMSRHWSKWELT